MGPHISKLYGDGIRRENSILTQPRTETIAGDPRVQLSAYLARRVTVPPATLQSAESEFATP